MIDHDRLFKELLTTFFWEFIQLFLPEVATYSGFLCNAVHSPLSKPLSFKERGFDISRIPSKGTGAKRDSAAGRSPEVGG